MSAKKPAPTRKRGRPPATHPKDKLVGLRLDAELAGIVERYQKREKLDDAPSAIRHMIRKAGEAESGAK